MEDNKKYDELKCILEDIKKAVSLYNDLNPEDKLSLTRQKEDVSNIFVCLHDDNKVGLFTREYFPNAGYDDIYNGFFESISVVRYDNFLVFLGINSHYIGIKFPHKYSDNLKKRFINSGSISLYHSKKEYLINCNIQEEKSFDDMRLMMYKEGLIEPYEIGKATNEEMLEVLKYAYNYYGLDKKVKKLTK